LTRRGRIALLLLLLVGVYAVPMLITLEVVPERLGDVVFAATMLVAVYATGTGRGRRVVISVMLAAFASCMWPCWSPGS
jgi:hypothetical protein